MSLPLATFVTAAILMCYVPLIVEPQKGLIAERVALLLGGDVEERKDLFSEIERLYKYRSDFVHQGENKITNMDISIISSIVFQVIVALIPLTKKMSTFGMLVEKFNTTKFSHPFENPA